jgi:mevalonate kinase
MTDTDDFARNYQARCPGRICLAGEDLDWIGGSAVLSAVELTTNVTAGPPIANRTVTIESAGESDSFPVDQLGRYDGGFLDHVRAATAVAAGRAAIDVPAVQLAVASTLPIGAGLSSSAAVIVATLAALNEYWRIGLSRGQICALAYEVEWSELRTGAGQMDFYSCTFGGIVHVDCRSAPPKLRGGLNMPASARIVVVDTRTPRSTKNVIRNKRERYHRRERGILRYFERVSSVVAELRQVLSSFSPTIDDVGVLVNECHEALRDDMGTSTRLIDLCVSACLDSGAAGAKLTGTGLGGCMFALVKPDHVASVLGALGELPVDIHVTSVDNAGLRQVSRRVGVVPDYR